jgi:tellurite resistance protein TerC
MPAHTSIWFWIAFHVAVFIALALDLASFKRRARALSMRAATQRSAIWMVLSLAFGALIWKWQGPQRGLDFLTGYLIEYSLSVDNIFVFVLIFTYFHVPPIAQHRVLVWGILGALVMRGVMIWLGVTLVAHFHFVLYLFGLFLLVTAVRMFSGKYGHQEFEDSLVMRLVRRSVHVTNEFHGEDFTAKIDNRWMLTPLALVLIVIDVMDLVFALFLARKPNRPIHLFENRPCACARLCWNQDDRRGLLPIAECNFTRRDPIYSCSYHHRLNDRDAEADQG